MYTYPTNSPSKLVYLPNEKGQLRLYFCDVDIKRVHIGKVIYKKVKELRIRPMELVKLMNFPSPNSLYYYYKQPSMDTGMLARFSEKIGYNFFSEYLSDEEKHSMGKPGVPYVDQKAVSEMKERLDKIQKDLLDAQAELLTHYRKRPKRAA